MSSVPYYLRENRELICPLFLVISSVYAWIPLCRSGTLDLRCYLQRHPAPPVVHGNSHPHSGCCWQWPTRNLQHINGERTDLYVVASPPRLCFSLSAFTGISISVSSCYFCLRLSALASTVTSQSVQLFFFFWPKLLFLVCFLMWTCLPLVPFAVAVALDSAVGVIAS